MLYDPYVLFRVPIYRESQEEYGRNLKERQQAEVARQVAEAARSLFLDEEEVATFLKEHPPHINPGGQSWRFNRIVGWVEFYADGMLIKTNLYLARVYIFQRRTRCTAASVATLRKASSYWMACACREGCRAVASCSTMAPTLLVTNQWAQWSRSLPRWRRRWPG